MTALHLAQLNIGRLRHEVGDPRMAEFVDNLAFVNGLAERSPGFVWRYQDDSGSAIETRPSADRTGGNRAAAAFTATRAERACLRLGEPAGRAAMEDGALRVRN